MVEAEPHLLDDLFLGVFTCLDQEDRVARHLLGDDLIPPVLPDPEALRALARSVGGAWPVGSPAGASVPLDQATGAAYALLDALAQTR